MTYTVESTATGTGYNGWHAYLAEDHSTRACNVAWANYLRHVGPLQDDVGSQTHTVTFRPFFPRQIKLCVYLNNPAGHRAVFAEGFTRISGSSYVVPSVDRLADHGLIEIDESKSQPHARWVKLTPEEESFFEAR